MKIKLTRLIIELRDGEGLSPNDIPQPIGARFLCHLKLRVLPCVGKGGIICPGLTPVLLKLTHQLTLAGLSSSLAIAGDFGSLPHGCLHKLPECPHDMAAGFPHRELSEEDSARMPAQDGRPSFSMCLKLIIESSPVIRGLEVSSTS